MAFPQVFPEDAIPIGLPVSRLVLSHSRNRENKENITETINSESSRKLLEGFRCPIRDEEKWRETSKL